MIELYKQYRPKTLREVIGQSGAIKSLEKMIVSDKIPHVILLTGPSGVGKTTIARILKQHLHCSDQDFVERNCADFRGVDDIREIRRHAGFCSLSGSCRIFLIDECHKLTKDAQDAFLKLLEDTPKKVYFILCTTEPQKLLKTVITRASQIKLASMAADDLRVVLKSVIKKEGFVVSEGVVDQLVEAAEGSARKALVILEQVGQLEDEEDQLKAIQTVSYSKEDAITLCRHLCNPRVNWADVGKVLQGLKDQEQDTEGIRYAVLGYFRSILVKGGPLAPRAFMIIDIFSRNFYDSKHAGLTAACWEVTHAKT